MRKILLVVLCLVAIPVLSQDKITTNFFDGFTLRQSFQSKNDKAEPAVFTFTKPDEKAESWMLNAAIGYNFLKNSNTNMTLDPYVEWHKNTLIDKVQNNWQVGVSWEWIGNIEQKKWAPVLITSVKYNDDEIKKNTSFQGSAYFTPIFKGKRKELKYFWIPNNRTDFLDWFQFTYSPYVGFENENRIKTENDFSSGSIYRAVVRITSSIALCPENEMLRDKFELNLDWQYRNDFLENVSDLTDRDHNYFTASFNYAFFSIEEGKKSAKIGFDYTNGENPAKNFEKQSFYALSLKVKL